MKVREALQSDTSEWSRMRTLLWPDTDAVSYTHLTLPTILRV